MYGTASGHAGAVAAGLWQLTPPRLSGIEQIFCGRSFSVAILDEENHVSGASRLRSLSPVLGLLMAALLLPVYSVVMPLALGGLAFLLCLLWLLWPAAYARVHSFLNGALHTLSAFITIPVLLMAYFLVLTPVALLMRCMGRDMLGRRHLSASSSKWRQPAPRVHDEAFFRVQF